MSFLNKISGTPLCSRLLALSLRNLSISVTATTTNRKVSQPADIQPGALLSLSPLAARHNTNAIKDIGIGGPLWRKKEILELPLTNKIIENPTQITKVIDDIMKIEKIIDLPTINNGTGDDSGKHAKNHMIMIRRRKMKKHKLRKLRKKMKFAWAKVKQKRNWRKEKIFQNELIAQVKEVEAFSAEKYVDEKIRLATETPIPRYWRHKRMPEFFIKQQLEKEAKRAQVKKFKMWALTENQ